MSLDRKDVFDEELEDSWTMESVGVLILVEQRQGESSLRVLDRMGLVSLASNTTITRPRDPKLPTRSTCFGPVIAKFNRFGFTTMKLGLKISSYVAVE